MRTASSTSRLNGAAPQYSSFKLVMSYLSTSGCLAMNTINGGTMKLEVGLYFSMLCRNESSSNLGSIMRRTPAQHDCTMLISP